MKPQEVLNQIDYKDGIVTSRATNKKYELQDFILQISNKLKWSKKDIKEFESYFCDSIQPQSDKSKYIEEIIEKYDFRFSDGVYLIRNKVITIDDIYRLFWREEKLLPTETDFVIENVEKISEPIELQEEIFRKIKNRAIDGESEYLKSLYKLYPDIRWHQIFYNIIVPKTKPLFHIFYDDGVGGTGKSTLLEVLTKIVGENLTSNVLLDQFGNRFIFSNMLGKYLNVGDDNGKNEELQNVGTLKSIITGNRVTIDRKNINPIEVRIFAKQLFATNILPYIDFTDGGIMRRLNIVQMNKVIPKDMHLCELDDNEIGHIIFVVLSASDLQNNESDLAITSSPLYRFYKNSAKTSYDDYKTFCYNYGFRQMNILNFEVKSKFIKHFISQESKKKLKDLKQISINDEDLPF